jgi:hypothetical protein
MADFDPQQGKSFSSCGPFIPETRNESEFEQRKHFWLMI